MQVFRIFQRLAPHALLAAALPAAELQYIPATLQNTSLADGTALKVVDGLPAAAQEITRGPGEAAPNNHWHWLTEAGSGNDSTRGVFASSGAQGNDAPMLRTVVTGLRPRTDYQVYGGFWISGFTSDAASPAGGDLWDIRLGCGIAAMMGYGFAHNAGSPGVIECGSVVPWKGGLRDRDGDRRMFGANLGLARTDANGTLAIYIDDQAQDTNAGRTCYDGIGVVPADSKAEIGSGAPGALHRALRCGDWESVRRELEAGADLNALDNDGLTPLFYACVDPNLERIATLLKAGARPDVEGQTLSPLWAAATGGHADLATLLLKSGAKIPKDPLPPNPLRDKFQIVARAHPAVAAICSGSLKVLKILIDQEPELDLDLLYASGWPSLENKSFDPPLYPVKDAVTHKHPELAEWLIDIGCQIQGEEARNLPEYAKWKQRLENSHGSRSLMIAAVMARPPMHGVVDALARRGVKMVDDNFVESDSVLPWDALSAAALAGDANLTERLLPAAAGVGQAYQTNLLVLARTGGDAHVMDLVEKRFGGVKMARWDGRSVSRQKERIQDDARVFEPRTTPFKPRTQVNGSKVLAVISDPDAAGPAAAITAKASTDAAWVCVEREEIESLLQESGFTKPWSDQVQNIGEFGDRLSADLLIIVSSLKSEKLNLLRIEAVDVRTGLPIDRIHLDEKEFNPNLFCDGYLPDIRRKLDAHLAGDQRTAITLLPVTVEKHLSGASALEGMLHAGLLQMMDQCRGVITLTRDQIQALAEEKALQDSGKLWGAAWTVEGGLRQLEGNQVELALRARSLGRDGLVHDAKASGNIENLQSLVRDAWSRMPATLKGEAPTTNQPSSDSPEQRARAESARLLREAEWLHHIHRNHDAAPLIDAALYLGGDPVKTNLLRMNIHMAMCPYRVMGRLTMSNQGPTQTTPEMPQSTALADEAAHHLGEFIELLEINSDTLNRLETFLADPANNTKGKGPLDEFWWNLDTFIFYRSVLQAGQMTPDENALLERFDKALDRHLKRLFALVTPTQQGFATLKHADQFSFLHFRTVPALADAMAEAIVRLWDCSDSPYGYSETIYQNFIGKLSYQGGEGLIPDRAGIMCQALRKAVENSNSPWKSLRLAELDFLTSSGEQRTLAAAKLLRTRISLCSGLRKPWSDWLPVYDLANWSPMPTSDIYFNFTSDLPHGDSLIPELFHTSGPLPDQLFRQNYYAEAAVALHAIKHQTASAWPYASGRLFEACENRLNQLAAASGSAAEFDGFLSKTRLFDRLLGFDHARRLEPKVLSLRPKTGGKSFGSKNQFPILAFDGTVDGKLLVDVRTGVTDKPAVITDLMVDPVNRHVLWAVLQPYSDWDFKLNEPILNYSTPQFQACAPWLLAIDSRDGHTIHKINLLAAAGMDSSPTSKSIYLGDLTFPSMIANDTHLLIQLYWRSSKVSFATLMIHRETGGVESLPDPVPFWKLRMSWPVSDPLPIAGVGKSFFCVDARRSKETDEEQTVLWQITPGENARIVARSGRRPEESPFDAQDRRIGYIARDGNRLLVASTWDHVGHYEPQSSAWSTDSNLTETATKNHVSAIIRNEFQATLFPQHLFKHEDGSVDAFAGPMDTEPGRLKFQNGAGPVYQVPVGLKPPEDYHARFQVLSQPLSGNLADPAVQAKAQYEWIRAQDMALSNLVSPAIMNQTDAGFILGSRIKGPTHTHMSVEHRVYFPFLWIIDKQAMRSGMKQAQQK